MSRIAIEALREIRKAKLRARDKAGEKTGTAAVEELSEALETEVKLADAAAKAGRSF